MRASAFGQEVSRLLGVRVGRMLTLGWALAAVVGSLAGRCSSPARAGSAPGVHGHRVRLGFIAAVVGGLDCPVGAVVGGLTVGLLLSLRQRLPRQRRWSPSPSLVILMVVLLVRPRRPVLQQRGEEG